MNDARLSRLDEIKRENFDVLRIYSLILNEGMPENTPALVCEISEEAGIDKASAYAALLSALCDLDPDKNAHDKAIEREYFSKIKMLSLAPYLDDPYYKNIKFPRVTSGRWSFGYETYAAYEPFVWRDFVVTDDYREIPQIGFFTEPFSFPAVYEDGREWMAVKPNEIETMRSSIAAVSGDVLTYGLGLGYFTYMASEKSEVKSITVVERDEAAIELFKTHILPQFQNRDKVKLVCSDAFDYSENVMVQESFDYVFADLWHDASDGLDLYIRLKRLEVNDPYATYLYWIEQTLLTHVRWMVYDALRAKGCTYEEICREISSDSLKSLACRLKKA